MGFSSFFGIVLNKLFYAGCGAIALILGVFIFCYDADRLTPNTLFAIIGGIIFLFGCILIMYAKNLEDYPE
jgi:hypothetical protein